MSKKSSFWRPCKKQHGKWDQTLLKSELHHLYHIYCSLWRELSSKKSLLVMGKISALFFNTLTAGHKYSVLNCDNLTLKTQMQLSLKGKPFSPFFFCIFEMEIKFWKFSKKDDPHSWYNLEVTDSENSG